MQQIKDVISQMIQISEQELENFTSKFHVRKIKKNELVAKSEEIPNEVFFINKGLLRVFIVDSKGTEHSLHFALENQFIADYANYINKTPAHYFLQALEETEVVVMPRSAIDWGYKHLTEGNKLGRLIAEYYFIYQDNRITNSYIRSPKERYEAINQLFPNINQRIPQHLITSYLGISSVHLSRLKNQK